MYVRILALCTLEPTLQHHLFLHTNGILSLPVVRKPPHELSNPELAWIGQLHTLLPLMILVDAIITLLI